MKQDLDRLLREHALDALVVVGPGGHNPAMVYLTGRPLHLTNAWLVKKPDTPPVLYHWPMERDEAAASGLPTRNLAAFSLRQYLDQTGGDVFQAQVRQLLALLDDMGLHRGRIGVTGRVELGPWLDLWQAVQQQRPEVQVLGVLAQQVLQHARLTKSPTELERIQAVGRLTVEVVGRVAERLQSLRPTPQGQVMDAEGRVVTIGQVKGWIRRWVAELGAELPLAVIFAQGYDAGVPHSVGTDAEPLRTGVPIVFDIFPQEAGGGYFFDFTRTWSLGYAPDEVLALHQQVLEAYHAAWDALQVGTPAHVPYDRACEVLEAYGHPTLRTHPGTQEGFVHSLGHGLGLEIHEEPRLGLNQGHVLTPGMVMTIEPGLYYPERGLGFRVEDTVYLDEHGPQVLATFPHDLVLPLRG